MTFHDICYTALGEDERNFVDSLRKLGWNIYVGLTDAGKILWNFEGHNGFRRVLEPHRITEIWPAAMEGL